MGLAGSGKTAAWMKAIHDESPAVRMGVLLALRRLGDPEIARFLDDPDPRLVLEAARAINDVPIPSATARLASLPVSASVALPLLRRILVARTQLGRAEDAAGLAAIAARSELPAAGRALALELLASWAAPQGARPDCGAVAADSGPARAAGNRSDRSHASRAFGLGNRQGADGRDSRGRNASHQGGRRAARGTGARAEST